MRQQRLKDFSAVQMRLVHLDLKGAAPKVSYLEQVFPLFSKLGANGILIEYEDMFPFKGELEVLKSPYAYSEEDISKILKLAELNKLEVVPLVQTFGHVEFILKHDKYRHLREVERFPNSFNPHVPETLALLKAVLAQVLSRHPRSSWVHIGADEVFHLGEGTDSKNWMSHNAGDVGQMYLKHVREVVDFVASQAPGLQVLLWDDMLRKRHLPPSALYLSDSGIPKHASPMLWFYRLPALAPGKHIAKYAECGFRTVWFASAFKGTTGPAQAWTPLRHHLQNHLRWLKVLQSMPRTPATRFQGIALTGWQRYDHYSALCELLPVGIPSLAVCLQTMVNGEVAWLCRQGRGGGGGVPRAVSRQGGESEVPASVGETPLLWLGPEGAPIAPSPPTSSLACCGRTGGVPCQVPPESVGPRCQRRPPHPGPWPAAFTRETLPPGTPPPTSAPACSPRVPTAVSKARPGSGFPCGTVLWLGLRLPAAQVGWPGGPQSALGGSAAGPPHRSGGWDGSFHKQLEQSGTQGLPRAASLPTGGFTEDTKKKVLAILGFQDMHLEKSTWSVWASCGSPCPPPPPRSRPGFIGLHLPCSMLLGGEPSRQPVK
uniref:beta-N-acetylhexosaminidase n=1 Tax=Varanus komodoensis TaxID=61221 RepID=A0A8D2LKB4_VARKO